MEESLENLYMHIINFNYILEKKSICLIDHNQNFHYWYWSVKHFRGKLCIGSTKNFYLYL